MNVWVKRVLMGLGGLAAALALAGGGTAFWATSTRDTMLARHFDITNAKDIPVPWPLSDAEVGEIRASKLAEQLAAQAVLDAANPPKPDKKKGKGKEVVEAPVPPPDPLAGVDLNAIALERSVARGNHLVSTIYGCQECHGANLAGHVVVDDPKLGAIICPNITLGKGSVTTDFKPSDWDKIVRHGVRPDGSPTIMPAIDFQSMSDQELSDIISYIRSFPPVDQTMDPPRWGPILTMLLATGQIHLSADQIDHTKDHMSVPPPMAADATFGEHLTLACRGCHGANFSGGPIKGGDPSWPPAANLTPTGFKDFTKDDFVKVMREGKKKDGTDVKDPMPWKMLGKLSDTELEAIFAYLKTLPPAETGVH